MKNWLIRTKSGHILGPVTKDKILELHKSKAIREDDEVSSGNGYWFAMNEQDLVTRFLLGNETQEFNPISEVDSVLGDDGIPLTDAEECLPRESDLDYPDLGSSDSLADFSEQESSSVDNTKVIDLSMLDESED